MLKVNEKLSTRTGQTFFFLLLISVCAEEGSDAKAEVKRK